MRAPVPTAEDASPRELRWASVRLFGMLALLAVVVVPIVRELPVGATTRIGILAWLLVVLALYWLYAGMGYRPLLLTQLILFSAAATLLTTKAMLVVVGIHRLSILRRTARALIVAGAVLAAINLGSMLLALWRQRRKSSAAP